MFDASRLAKNKKDLLEIHSRLQTLVGADQGAFLADPRNALAVKYLLIEAVEAISDTCQHLLSKTKAVACDGYVDCILKAGEQGIIPASLSNRLRKLADLRNHLIHRYWIINDQEIYENCRNNLADFTEFAEQIDRFLAQMSQEKAGPTDPQASPEN
ncbi:MAG: DUF86 domain-containing protein [Planctomycetes bacterium]|nr:DUF86 domain-containing protein [Planctomycetota bacterium]